ncbi:uncharacterized protein BT62DRAFT_992826 [Guyanagaster necrorhizus]|uniref:Uncharacterized protein n=1 Tax=Guyanagaster necrorhizus TaxID=856835 RepID=A0A9P8AV33_9AGAR|nr:uncharacterized protein BT62DRAFT_992826 [Guyanagaster necrorhizus MCA 3950]KAG7448895.1 hypothetical protein BT62DRAFT_992826 [Guyanagaster necrorhizus MCA 3950]
MSHTAATLATWPFGPLNLLSGSPGLRFFAQRHTTATVFHHIDILSRHGVKFEEKKSPLVQNLRRRRTEVPRITQREAKGAAPCDMVDKQSSVLRTTNVEP